EENIALTDALTIINQLEPEGRTTNDPETLGITGAIYKRLWLNNQNTIEYLDRAIKYYKKGFTINSDYYTGENYALCLDFKSYITSNPDEKIYYRLEAKKTRETIIEIIHELENDDDFLKRSDLKWIYATLSNCFLALDDQSSHQQNEQRFYELTSVAWELETYEKSKQHIIKILNK
ncbi:MAG: DUF4071 domain-containing protein, partial [Flavobacterium sp.]|nr:DUF4071 domain-containing protein [Flavobacterium sp.]